MIRPRRVLGYARVSSEEQARGSSLQDQQDAIAGYAKGQGLKVARFYVEAESAVHEKIERREQIRALMADVREGDLIVCDKLDRWSRDGEFSFKSIREILEAGANFYAVAEGLDASTPQGDTQLSFRVAFAREEHKRIKERMVGTRKRLRDHGLYSEGLPPFGYRRSLPKGEKGADKNVLVVVPDEAELVRRAFSLCIARHSLTKIARALGIARDRVHHVLGQRVYLGEIQDAHGQWIKARHPAIVDADTFARARAASKARRLGGARPREAPSATSGWILRDVATCAKCGARMSAAYAGGGNGLPYTRFYYHCFKGCPGYVPVQAVEAAAEPLIVARLQDLREELARAPEPVQAAPQPDYADRRAKLQRRREKYLDAFADELMTRDELRAALGKLDDDALKIDAAEQEAKRLMPTLDRKARRETLRSVNVIARAWKLAKPEARRELVGHLATQARIAQGHRPAFTWRPVEELVREVG
ncbi:MAG: recombinase family protein [Polyangiaceae bacterium]